MIKQLDRSYFETIYEMMEEAFPYSEHRDKQAQYALFDLDCYEVYGWFIDGELTAFLAAWNLGSVRFGEHLATRSDRRNLGLGKQLLQAYENLSDKPIVLEVELPETTLAMRRIQFYERLGFRLYLDFPYHQPSFHQGLKPLPLHLMMNGPIVSKTELLEIATLIYREVYDEVFPITGKD